MSEVKRYTAYALSGPAGDVMKSSCGWTVYFAADFDRVTAERDAALGRELQSRNDLAKSLADHFRKNAEISALQQRLTAADEREDAARAFVSRLIESAGGKPSIAIGYLSDILDALKPAEGGGDE